MTIYIDIVLIENLIMNYIILLATGIILKVKIKHIRIILASLLGAIYVVVAYISPLEIYASIILKLLLSIIIVYVAFNTQNSKQLLKYILIFYMTSFVFGGAAFALIYIVKPQDILKDYQIEKTANFKQIKMNNFMERQIPDKYKKIYNLINKEGTHINNIAKKLKRPIQEINQELFMMELEGFIEKRAGGYYVPKA